MKRIVSILIIGIFLFNSPLVAYGNMSELDFYEAFEDHGSVMIITDMETGDIIYANKAASRFYGYTKEELKSMKIEALNVLTTETAKEIIEQIENEEKHRFVVDHKLANGEIRTVDICLYPYNIDGKIVLIEIVNDITDKIRFKNIDKILINILIGMLILLLGISYLIFKNLKKLKIQNHEIKNFNELRKTFTDANHNSVFLKDEGF